MKIKTIESTCESQFEEEVNKFCEGLQVYDVRVILYEYAEQIYHFATITYEGLNESNLMIKSLQQHIAGLEAQIKKSNE